MPKRLQKGAKNLFNFNQQENNPLRHATRERQNTIVVIIATPFAIRAMVMEYSCSYGRKTSFLNRFVIISSLCFTIFYD